jgi:hypothetical protein
MLAGGRWYAAGTASDSTTNHLTGHGGQHRHDASAYHASTCMPCVCEERELRHAGLCGFAPAAVAFQSSTDVPRLRPHRVGLFTLPTARAMANRRGCAAQAKGQNCASHRTCTALCEGHAQRNDSSPEGVLSSAPVGRHAWHDGAPSARPAGTGKGLGVADSRT